MTKYYALKDIDGYKNIVNSWAEAEQIIKTLNKPKYKSFQTLEEAHAFLDDVDLTIKDNYKYMAYIDGSYDELSKRYSFGCILLMDGNEYIFKKAFSPDEYSEFRNVSGEIKGASFIINYAISHNIDELHIYYDYIGIEKWFLREWKANTLIAKKYQEFADSVRDKIKVCFHKVKSHANDYYNEKVDKLAKSALGLG